MKKFTEINAATAVDVTRHAVIEASAGTGKTYTLIELVMRLLLEQRMNIDQLLLVTFTDQATGELKSRIRQRLWAATELADDDELKLHLEHNLNQLNQASIFTIHGFCHGALKEFAFEQGAVFDAEVVNDQDIWSLILRKMKRQWPADQALIKQLQPFTAEKSISNIDALLLQLAGKFKPEFDSIYPCIFNLSIEDNINKISDLLGFSNIKYEVQFQALKGLKATSHKNLWLAVIKPFLHELSSIIAADDVLPVVQLFNATFAGKSDVNEVFFKGCPVVFNVEHKDSAIAENLALAPDLFALIAAINSTWQSVLNHQKNAMFRAIPALLNELMQASQQYKLDRGLISYNDMILHLWQQLVKESGLINSEQLLTQAMRNKYQVAIIDEFQDTDIRQWQIFEQLFLKSTNTQHRLWVIGDPKQAIYGFRGADLHTYEAAKTSIIEHYQGNAYRLGTNYRTDAGLLAAMNQFFADDTGGWFNADEVHVNSPTYDLNNIIYKPQVIDNNGLNYFNCLSVEQADADTIKSQLAEKIAATIKHQIINRVEVQLKGTQRFLNASDVCILVRSNGDAEFIEQALQQLEVPFTFHKKKNLYQSIEAIHFHVLLTALSRPDEIKRVNNALLTLFFDLQPAQLNDFAEEQLPVITALWLQAKEAVMAKDWIKVFDLLLNEGGAMYRARNNSRRTANIKQLKQQLLKAALQNNLGADALLKFYQQKRDQSSTDEDLHHKDTEKKSVKIMTMHISKGLEFPVVFLFGGFGQGPGDQFLQYYDEDQQGMVYDLVKHHQAIYDEQQLKAAHQLYYVAMTRAIFMLFVPFVDETEKKIPGPGLYVQTVMARLNETNMSQLNPPAWDELAAATDTVKTTTEPPVFNLSVPQDIAARRRNLHSFSSLSRMKSHSGLTPLTNDFSQSLTAELMNTESPIKQNTTDTVIPQIPGGVKTGHVLHGIFEHVDFNQVDRHESPESVYKDERIMAVIDQQMQQFKLENKDFEAIAVLDQTSIYPLDYRQQLADWTWHTLKKPLAALKGKNLAKITLDNRCHELSFFWNEGPTHLTGFIDLFFAVSNDDAVTDYYILDWKSNYSPNGYSPSVLSDEVMSQHQYHWQYQLYAMAMQRWFDALQLKNARLKGAIYVFSRGVNCHEDEQNGVFYDDFTEPSWQIDDIKTELLAIDQYKVKS